MNEEGTLIRMVPDLSGCDLTVDDMDLEVAVRNALKRSAFEPSVGGERFRFRRCKKGRAFK